MIRIILVLCVSVAYGKNLDTKKPYCYANDIDPYIKFGTKTGYEFIHGGDDNYHIIPNCKPVYFWSLNRHGTRYPTPETTQKLKTLPKIQQEIIDNYNDNEVKSDKEMCEKDIELFRTWSWDENIEKDPGNLTIQGWFDMLYLAERQKKRFPGLLGIPYSKKNFYIRYTVSERTMLSFKAFTTGLFKNIDDIKAHSYSNDTLLDPYATCPYWEDNVENNPDTYAEHDQLKEQKKYKKLIKNVSKRLGFTDDLKKSVITDMYHMCSFEKAWYLNKKPSSWCAAFTRKQLKILEYGADLTDYYEYGYGTDVNAKVPCLLIKDIMQRFEKIINGSESDLKATLYFAHSGSLEMLITAMGMYKDATPLKADNMKEQKRRLWRTSFLFPFAANFDAILYSCNQGDKYRVLFALNEKPAVYSDCPSGICTWQVVKKKLLDLAQNCNVDFC